MNSFQIFFNAFVKQLCDVIVVNLKTNTLFILGLD